MNIFLTIILIVLIITIITYFKGKDINRTIVVYEDWNDVGLSFFSIVFPFFVIIIMTHYQSISKYALPIGFLLMVILLIKLAIDTYKSNNGNFIYFIT